MTYNRCIFDLLRSVEAVVKNRFAHQLIRNMKEDVKIKYVLFDCILLNFVVSSLNILKLSIGLVKWSNWKNIYVACGIYNSDSKSLFEGKHRIPISKIMSSTQFRKANFQSICTLRSKDVYKYLKQALVIMCCSVLKTHMHNDDYDSRSGLEKRFATIVCKISSRAARKIISAGKAKEQLGKEIQVP